jgi:hypothetical protein
MSAEVALLTKFSGNLELQLQQGQENVRAGKKSITQACGGIVKCKSQLNTKEYETEEDRLQRLQIAENSMCWTIQLFLAPDKPGSGNSFACLQALEFGLDKHNRCIGRAFADEFLSTPFQQSLNMSEQRQKELFDSESGFTAKFNVPVSDQYEVIASYEGCQKLEAEMAGVKVNQSF